MADLTYHQRPHGVEDPAKVEALAASMAANGWVGAPIVTWFEDIQITGVHRQAAAAVAGIDPETIDLEDLFAEDGADYAEFCAEVEAGDGDLFNDLRCVVYYLSASIREKYGIDLH